MAHFCIIALLLTLSATSAMPAQWRALRDEKLVGFTVEESYFYGYMLNYDFPSHVANPRVNDIVKPR